MLEFLGVAQVDLIPFGTSFSRDHAARGMLILKKLYVHIHALLLVDAKVSRQDAWKKEGKQTR